MIAIATSLAPDEVSSWRRLKNILGGSGGNLVEWFDWFSYAALSVYFAAVFFPEGDQTTQFLKSAVVFGVGFIARPLGAWLMGRYCDRVGRKAGLVVSIIMMCFGSLMIALTPGYAEIGIFAPVLLTTARIIQGLSLGGEYGASATYISEMAGRSHRGFWSGVLYITLIGGQLLALGLLSLLQLLLSPAALHSWGWRIPFVVGALLAVVVLWMRRDMDETASYRAARKVELERGSTISLISTYPRETAFIFWVSAAGSCAFYVYTTYMQKFLINSAAGPMGEGFSKGQASQIMLFVLVTFMIMQPICGWLSDVIGRRSMLVGAFGLGAVTAYPIHRLLLTASTPMEAVVLCTIPLIILSGYTAVSAIFKAELFPAHVRSLGVGLPYAVASAFFSGNAESGALWFKHGGNESGFYLVLSALLATAFVASALMKDPKRHSRILY
jgi:MHS family alpha-ketoglutarate permease-like MFS transporter